MNFSQQSNECFDSLLMQSVTVNTEKSWTFPKKSWTFPKNM